MRDTHVKTNTLGAAPRIYFGQCLLSTVDAVCLTGNRNVPTAYGFTDNCLLYLTLTRAAIEKANATQLR